ncbi:MAG: hypothetical protein ABI854_03580, partial [Betaproteobacteria bacterium]
VIAAQAATPSTVVPAQAGTQRLSQSIDRTTLGPRLRGDDIRAKPIATTAEWQWRNLVRHARQYLIDTPRHALVE